MAAGYSSKPLAEKLGIVPGIRVWFHDMPDHVREEIDPDGVGADEQASPSDGMQAALLFVTERARLERQLTAACPLLQSKGFIWAAWPKKTSKVATDITEDVVRDVALPLGLVDIKVCAIDDTWSGLKLVIRKANREPD